MSNYWHIDITRGQVHHDGAGPWHYQIFSGKEGDKLVHSGDGFSTAIEAAKQAKHDLLRYDVGAFPPADKYLFINAPKDAERWLLEEIRKESSWRRGLIITQTQLKALKSRLLR